MPVPKLWKSRLRPRREIENFDLRIWKGPRDEYVANVRDPSGRVAESRFSSPFTEAEIREALAAAVGQSRDMKPAPPKARNLAKEFGRRLFERVFTGEIQWAWRRHLDGAVKDGEELRLRLMLNDPEIWNWPWEFLHDGKSSRGFLAVVPGMPLVRYIEHSGRVRPLRVRPPIHILAVSSSPSGVAQLSVKEELDDLEKSLEPLRQDGWVTFERLERATRETLLRKLKDETFHVLHFVGHSTFDADQGGRVLLESESGSPDPIGSQDLSLLLKVPRRLRLIVLNACEGARGDRSDDFAGLAQNLVKNGFPAVIAMRSVISDPAAVTFSRYFYEALSRREPVDRAISEARQAMFFKDSTMEWGSPVLVMRCPDGVLFDLTRLEIVIARIRRFIAKWRRTLLVLLLLALGLAAFRSTRRWIDPNFLWTAFNPPECPSPSGLRIAFVLVQPGRFTVGDVEGDSRTRREAAIERPYCIARYETTQRLWTKVMKEKRSRRKGAGLPVVSVSVDDARAFFEALNRREPKARFRLPSNDEWEYAARAGGKAYLEAPPDSANCKDKESNDGFEGTAPVGLFKPNAWDLYDMFGNVAEWVTDEANYRHIRRGGSYENALENCDSTFESAVSTKARADTGFRIVREPG
ncbi:MAG TPA: CHAT domain-containing protein [Thermoanaerobaculia bacterium]|nr:CHAT domain-containing protein [Thermoanaerobaculia bacterium]